MPRPHSPIKTDQSREVERARPEMLTVQQVAEMLGCSTRHVYRLADSGKMPKPVRVGTLVRWSFDGLATWINQGCPRPQAEEESHG